MWKRIECVTGYWVNKREASRAHTGILSYMENGHFINRNRSEDKSWVQLQVNNVVGVYGSLLIIQFYRKIASMPSYKYELVEGGWVFEEQKERKPWNIYLGEWEKKWTRRWHSHWSLKFNLLVLKDTSQNRFVFFSSHV